MRTLCMHDEVMLHTPLSKPIREADEINLCSVLLLEGGRLDDDFCSPTGAPQAAFRPVLRSEAPQGWPDEIQGQKHWARESGSKLEDHTIFTVV